MKNLKEIFKKADNTDEVELTEEQKEAKKAERGAKLRNAGKTIACFCAGVAAGVTGLVIIGSKANANAESADGVCDENPVETDVPEE